jgi:hypothetical protein
MSYKNRTGYRGVVCCSCGQGFKRSTWSKEGVLKITVNAGIAHYACKPCRAKGFDALKHAAENSHTRITCGPVASC